MNDEKDLFSDITSTPKLVRQASQQHDQTEEKKGNRLNVDAETIVMLMAQILDKWLVSLKDRKDSENAIILYDLIVFSKSARKLFGADRFKDLIKEKYEALSPTIDFEEWYDRSAW